MRFFFRFSRRSGVKFDHYTLFSDSAEMYANDLAEMRAAGTARLPFFSFFRLLALVFRSVAAAVVSRCSLNCFDRSK